MKSLYRGIYMKGIIFDCDGVLFDTLQANSIYYDILRSKIGLPPLTEEEHKAVYSVTVQESLERFTPQEKLADIMSALNETPYLETALPYIELDKELPHLLQSLKDSDKKIGVFTNRTRSGVLEVLQQFGIYEYFSEIVTCDEVAPKPSAEGLYLIEKRWGIPLKELVFVGDSMTDYGSAQQTDVTLVAFRNKSIPTALHIERFSELAPIMGVA